MGELRQVERQWEILNAIGKYGVSKIDLVRGLEVNPRTIERDINTLCMVGFPILSIKDGRNRIYQFCEKYNFPRKP